MKKALCFILMGCIVQLMGCRGWTTENPPIHPNPNMDVQPKYKPYRTSDWFLDKRSMRMPVEGTIARGELKLDTHLYEGKNGGQWVDSLPRSIVLNRKSMKQGQTAFNIHCAACHGQTGAGNGLVGKRMVVAPTSLHSDYLYAQPLGHFYDVISNGIRTMPSYRHQISVEDRWLIVAYIRALQWSQNEEALKKRLTH